MIKSVTASIVLVFLSLWAGAPAFAAGKAEVYTGRFSNLAVDGYDVVAYFTEEKPVRGTADFQTTYQGANWRFASQETLDTFLAAPASYAPQYGGYCAWAVSQGYTAPGSPKAWSIVNGKLYLNYDQRVQEGWSKDIPGFIAKGDANWPSVLN